MALILCKFHLPSFYREVLKHYQITKQAFQNDTSHHDEIIWNDRNIKIECKTRFYKTWFEKSLLRIEDLLQNEGNFLSFNQFSKKIYLETPFTLYFGLINSIPSKWKLAIKRTPRQMIIKQTLSLPKTSTPLFPPPPPPPAESKILRYGFNQANIKNVYELPFQIKNDVS